MKSNLHSLQVEETHAQHQRPSATKNKIKQINRQRRGRKETVRYVMGWWEGEKGSP